MARVLFVCTGNTCRSPLAERLARLHFPQHRWESAGAAAEAALNPLAATVLAERGADSSGFEPRPVQDLDLQAYDAVVLIGERAVRLHLPEGPARYEWSVADPLDAVGDEAERLVAYRHTADELLRRIEALAGEL